MLAVVKARVPTAKRLQVDPRKIGTLGGFYTDVPPDMPSLKENDLYLKARGKNYK